MAGAIARRLAGSAHDLVLHAPGWQGVLDHRATILAKNHVMEVAQHLDLSPAGAGHFVVIALDGDEAVFVDGTIQQLVRGREMPGQWRQELAFVFEGLRGNEAGLALRSLFHPHGGPRQSLVVEILQTGKRAARNEVGFDGQEAAFLACFPIRMLGRMAQELEAVAAREDFHLRDHHRASAQPAPTGQIGVVDDADPRRITPMHQGQMQEALQVKAIEDGVELQIPPLGIPQIKQAGLQPQPLRAHPHCERAGIMLHLRSGFVGHFLTARRTRAGDAQVPQMPRQGRVFDRDAVFFPQLFGHALGVALTLLVQLAQQVAIQHHSRRATVGGICPDWVIIRRTALRLSRS